MKNFFILFFLIFIIVFSICSDAQYELGAVSTRSGNVIVQYIKEKRDYIKLVSAKDKSYLKIFLPEDLKALRAHFDKFEKWHKTAVDNNYTLNKTIGKITTFRIDFITIDGKYEIGFIEEGTGLRVATFDLKSLQLLKEVISDKNIDYVINEEKRKKEKEDALFQ